MNDRETPRLLVLVLLLTAILIGVGVVSLARRAATGGAPFPTAETEDRPQGERRHEARARTPRARDGSASVRAALETPDAAPDDTEPPGGVRLIGLLLDESGAPVKGAHVAVHALTGRILATAETGDQGEYAVEGLPPGRDVAVQLRAAGFLAGWCCDVRTVDEGTGRMGTIHLRSGARLEVSFTGDTALREQVVIEREDGVTGEIAGSEEGLASGWIGFLGTGTHRWRARLGDAVSPWQEVTIDARGRVRGAGAGSAAQELALDRPLTLVAEVGPEEASAEELAGTASLIRKDGEIVATVSLVERLAVFRAVWPGESYDVVVRTEDGRAGRTSVTDARAERVRVALETAGRARVVVSDPAHDVVAGVHVVVAGDTVASNEAGVALFEGLAPGTYAVTVSDGRHRLPPQDEPRVVVAAGYESQIDLTVVDSPRTSLRVRVTDEVGRPIGELPLRVTEPPLSAVTDHLGHAEFPDLAIGTPVEITSDAARVTTGRSGGTIRPELGADVFSLVAVPRDQAPDVDEPVRRVSGRVVDLDDRPVEGARIGGGRRWITSDEDGRFELLVPRDLTELAVGSPDRMWVPRTLAIEEEEDVTLGQVELQPRPIARIEFGPGEAPTRFHARQVLLATDFRDEFLGGDRAALEASWIVTYDGTWIVLPPWSTDGRPLVMTAELTDTGLHTDALDWSPRSEPDVRLRPEVASEGLLLGARRSQGELVQVSHGTTRAIETRTLDHPAAAVRGADPFSVWLAAHPVRIALTRRKRRLPLAAGAWRFDPNLAADGPKPLVVVPAGGRVALPDR